MFVSLQTGSEALSKSKTKVIFISVEFDEYMIEVALSAAAGPYMTARHLHHIASAETPEIRKEEIAYAAAVEAGALAMQYSMLQFLNAVQGPKYAMSFHQLHMSLNPMRGMIVKQAAPTAAAIYGARELAVTPGRNVAIEPVEGVSGAYRLSASDDFYYPGKSLVDYLFGDE